MDQFQAAVAFMSTMESEPKRHDGSNQFQETITSILTHYDDRILHRAPLGATVAARIKALWPHRRPRAKVHLDPAAQS